jgi:hypothetical protein
MRHLGRSHEECGEYDHELLIARHGSSPFRPVDRGAPRISTTERYRVQRRRQRPLNVANAVYNACGVRIRDYPLTPDKVLKGLGTS